MKTSEFIKRINEIGLVAKLDSIVKPTEINIYKHGIDGVVAYVKINKMFTFSIFEKINNSSLLIDIISEYAKTPLEKRNDGKNYLLKLKLLPKDENSFLGFAKRFGDYGKLRLKLFDIKENENNLNLLFSEDQINEIKSAFRTNLSCFEMIEVNNEDK